MGNKHNGSVTFDALGKRWTMRYSTNAMCEIENAFNDTIVSVANKMQDASGLSMQNMRTIFRFGVEGCESDAHAGDLMDEIGIAECGDLIGKAFVAAFPDDNDESKPDEGKPKATGG